MQRNFLGFLIAVLLFGFSCRSDADDVHSRQKTDGIENSLDSNTHLTFTSTDAIQKYLDSIVKSTAGTVTITTTSIDTSSQHTRSNKSSSHEIAVFNFSIADSIIEASKQKYVLFHFWATWCAPCRKEFPELLIKLKKHDNVSPVLISCDINTKEQRQKVLSYYKTLDTYHPLYMMQQNEQVEVSGTHAQEIFLQKFGVKNKSALPFNLLINSETKKVLVASGNNELVLSQIQTLEHR